MRVRRRPLLSAALIVRNEARCLDACLASVRPIADEIVVVDTGSTDGTMAIARRWRAMTGEFAWRDDFAAARNHALGLARGRFVLYIDADERVASVDRDELRRQLTDRAFAGYHVLLHPRPGFTAYREMRLFVNHPLVRFRNVMHESIWPGLRDYQARHGGRIGQSSLVLEHDGYEGDQRAKHARDLPLLERALRDDPARVYCWWHLGRAHLGLGDAGAAERAWTTAIELVRNRREAPTLEDALPYLALIARRLDAGEDAEALLDEVQRLAPANAQVHWLRGRALMRASRHREALACFEWLLARGERRDLDRSTAYDARIFGVLAFESLATCHFQLRDYAQSREYFELAARHDAGNVAYRVKRDLAARLEREAVTPAAV